MTQTLSRGVFQAHPMADDPADEPPVMGNARRAIGQALIKAYALTCGDHKPSEAMLVYFRSVIEEEDRLHAVSIARLDAILTPPPDTTTQVKRVAGETNPIGRRLPIA